MSQQEFEQADNEVIEMVENHAHPEAVAAAEEILKGETRCTDNAEGCCCRNQITEAELRRQILWTAIQVLACVLVAALFVAALLDSAFVVFLANLGVLICGMRAAVLVDRAVRRWRKR